MKKAKTKINSSNKDIYIMLVGMIIVLLAFISLFWTSQISMVTSVLSIFVMIVGILVTIWGFNS